MICLPDSPPLVHRWSTSFHVLARELIAGCDVVVLDSNVVDKAMVLEDQSGLSYWDCLIVAAALLSSCDTLYSEDMQHGQIFEGRLTVLNPFLD